MVGTKKQIIMIKLIDLIEAFFIGENQEIKCKKCGWEWREEDGGDDPYTCHKCGFDNSYIYQDEMNDN